MLLIITACISVEPEVPCVSIRNASDRLQDYLKTIEWAIEETDFSDILFCDNSNFDLDAVNGLKELKKRACIKRKNLECYSFRGNAGAVQAKGKGYGEGEIISWLYDNCPTMRTYQYYYKITGRLTINNIQQIHLSEKAKNTFIFDVGSKCVDTRFYKLSMKDYKIHFKNVFWEVDDTQNIFLEYVYYHTLISRHLSFERFNRSLEFRGRSGTSGVEYCTVYNENLMFDLIYGSFLYSTYFGRKILKYVRCIVVKE